MQFNLRKTPARVKLAGVFYRVLGTRTDNVGTKFLVLQSTASRKRDQKPGVTMWTKIGPTGFLWA